MAEAGPHRPAFPQTADTLIGAGSGMTLRDYFAAHALAFTADASVNLGDQEQNEHVAKVCYGIADAMMKERAK